MNRSFGYVTRRRRHGRTARRRRRNRRNDQYARAVGIGRFAAADHRERIMERGEYRARTEQLYASPLGRLQLAMRPGYTRTRTRPGPTEPAWVGASLRGRASMPGPMRDGIINPAIYISQQGAPTQGVGLGRSRLGFNFNTN